MIPRTLELKNFLSYGDPVQSIDFKDYNLICLSGKNGNGKSALLDALTWALWGQARKTTGTIKADEGLIRLGQTRMMVCLTFEFGNSTYRVRREFAKTYGKPFTALDFEIFDPAQDKFLSLTDKTIRATQEAIDRTLKLDYETFINSAFVRQGQANEFSKKSAKERKQILAAILGLSHYDLLQQQALEQVRTVQDEKRNIVALHDQNINELANEGALQDKLQSTQVSLATLTKELDALIATKTDYEKEFASHQLTKNNLISLQQEFGLKQNAYREGANQLIIHRQKWQQTHALSLHAPDINVLHNAKKQLLQEEKELLALQRKALELQEQIITSKDKYQKCCNTRKQELDSTLQQYAIEVQKYTLTIQHQQLLMAKQQQQLQELDRKYNTLRIEQQTIEQQIKNHSNDTQQLATLNAQFDKRRGYYQTLVQRGNWTQQALDALAHKQKVINDRNNPSCPLCEQLLTAKRKQFLGQQFNQEESFLQHRFKRISLLLKSLKALLLQQHNEVQALTKQVEQQQQKSNHLQELTKQTQQLELDNTNLQKTITQLQNDVTEQNIHLEKANQQLATLEKKAQETLAHDPELKAIAAVLAQLEQEKARMPQTDQQAQAIHQQLNEIEHQLTLYQTLKTSIDQQQERKNAIYMLCRELKTLKSIMNTLQVQLQTLNSLEIKEHELSNNLQTINHTIMQQTSAKDQLLQTIGSIEHELKRLQVVKGTVADQQKLMAMLDENLQDFQVLATAFSKNGIQALLIEEAIPEIEHEANLILSRLTNNQAQIFIESLRDLKSGGVKETLDIQIADTAGIRPYEMYSGGEAFRVDFALRIAISKLLARRAGTALQTLIIDEGFGSQDEDGLTAIMEAIYAIQNDFSKIIVVSHLPEFKHYFPVHFIVDKGPTGSLVSIEERG